MSRCLCSHYGHHECVTIDVLTKAVKDDTIARIRGIHYKPSVAEVIALFDAVAYNTSLTRISYYFFAYVGSTCTWYMKPKHHDVIACSLSCSSKSSLY
jgi:hypothetical protein